MGLDELRAKYPSAESMKYEPKPDCEWCHGTGEATARRGKRPCICTYVDHQIAELVQESLNRVVHECAGALYVQPATEA